MLIRFLTVAVGILIATNIAASADPRFQHPVLRTYQPLRIALPDFISTSVSGGGSAHAISQIIVSDLKQSGAFASIDPAAFADKNTDIDEMPHFADWRAINAQGVVIGRVTQQPDARIRVEFRLWDAFGGKQLAGQRYTGAPDELHRIGHMIAGDIYERITGKKRTFE